MPTYLVIGANTMNCDSTTNSASASGPEFDPQRLKFKVSNVTLLNGHPTQNTVRGFSLATLAAALAACGGGGSGGPTPPPPPPPNNAPTATNASGTVVEDGTATATGGAVGSDSDGDSLTYNVTSNGTYGSLETAADGSWTYTINNDSSDVQALGAGATLTDTATIEVRDPDGATASATVTITIEGANDNPAGSDSTGGVTAGMGEAAMGNVGAMDVDTGDTHTFAVGDAPDYGTLSVDEAGNWSYTVDDSNAAVRALPLGTSLADTGTIVISDSAGGSVTVMVTITIEGANDNPTGSDGTGAVTAGAAMTAQGNVNAMDVDTGDTHTFAVGVAASHGTLSVDEAGNWSYMVDDANGAVRALAHGATMDDTGTIVITDNNGGTATVNVTVTITGRIDAPEVSNGAIMIKENDASAANIAEVTSPDSGVTFSVNHNDFEIETVGSTAILKLKEGVELNHEAHMDGIITLMITATDAAGNVSPGTAVTVTVVDVNEAPSISVMDGGNATSTIVENMTGAVGVITATDPDQMFTAADFSVSDPRFGVTAGADGSLLLMLNEGIDAEVDDSVTVMLTVTDNGENGPMPLSASTEVTVSIVGVNEVPTIAFDPIATSGMAVISEGETGSVGQITLTDQEEMLDASDLSFSNSSFGAKTDDNGSIWLVVNEAPDYEMDGDSISVTVTVTDSDGLTAMVDVDVAVANVNEAPTISVKDGETADGKPAKSVVDEHVDGMGDFMPVAVGEITLSDPEQTLTEDDITVTGGDGRFGVMSDGLGGIWLMLNKGLDADVEGGGSIMLTVSVEDDGGLMDSADVTITVNNINEMPTIMLQEGVTPADDGGVGASGTLDENAMGPVYEIIVTDPEDDLMASNIAIDDKRFEVRTDSEDGLWVYLADPVNYEEVSSIDIIVTVTDMDGASAMASETVSIRNINDAPQPNQDGVVWVKTAATDTAPAVTETLKNLTATAGSGIIQMTLDLGSMFSDEDGEKNFRYTLEDAPAWLKLINVQYKSDGSTTGDLVGTVPAGSDVSALGVKIVATDDGGPTGMPASGFASFNIVVDDGNDRPTEITLMTTDLEENIYFQVEVDENDGTGKVLGYLTVTDQDNPLHPHGQHKWTVDNTNFEIVSMDDMNVLKVKDGVMLDHEAAATLTITVTAADGGTPALSAMQAITVTVHDMNDPVVLKNAPGNWWVTIDEDTDPRTVAKGAYLTFGLETAGDMKPLFTDGDAADAEGNLGKLTYAMEGPSWLEIDAATGTITNKAGKAGDELPERGVYDITVSATDGAGSSQQASFELAVAVSGAMNEDNDDPDIGSRDEMDIAENSPEGTVVASFTVTDDDLDLADGSTALHPWADVTVRIEKVMGTPTDGGNAVALAGEQLKLVETGRDAGSISYNVVIAAGGVASLDYEMYDEITFDVRAFDGIADSANLDDMNSDVVGFDFEITDVNEAPAYMRDTGSHSSAELKDALVAGMTATTVTVEQSEDMDNKGTDSTGKVMIYLNLSKLFEDPDEDDDDDELTFSVSTDTPWITVKHNVGEWRDVEEGPDGDDGTDDDVDWGTGLTTPDGRDLVAILEIDRTGKNIAQDADGGITLSATDAQGMMGSQAIKVTITDENLNPAATAKGVTLTNDMPDQDDALGMSFDETVDPDFTGVEAGEPVVVLYEWSTDDDADATNTNETLVSVSVDSASPLKLTQAHVGKVIQGSVVYFEVFDGMIVQSGDSDALVARSGMVENRQDAATGSIMIDATNAENEIVASIDIKDPDGINAATLTYTWEYSANGRGGWATFADNDAADGDATMQTTTIGAAQQGTWVRLIVEFDDTLGASERFVSDAVKVGAITHTATPAITGFGTETNPSVGRTLMVDAKGGEVEWLSDGKVIGTGSELTLTDAHAGAMIGVRVTTKSADGGLTSIATSEASAMVTVAGDGPANTVPLAVADVPVMLLGKAPVKDGELVGMSGMIDADSLFEDIEGGLKFSISAGFTGSFETDLYPDIPLDVHLHKNGDQLFIFDSDTGAFQYFTTKANDHGNNKGDALANNNVLSFKVTAMDGANDNVETNVTFVIDAAGTVDASMLSFQVTENQAVAAGESITIDIYDSNSPDSVYGQYDWSMADGRFTVTPDTADSSMAVVEIKAGTKFEIAPDTGMDAEIKVMVTATPKGGAKGGHADPIMIPITVTIKNDAADDTTKAGSGGTTAGIDVPGLKDNEDPDDGDDTADSDNDGDDDGGTQAPMDAMASLVSALDDGMF